MRVMRGSKRVSGVEAALLVVLLLKLTEADSQAYIDPGTGSVVLQLLAGLFFAGLITIKRWSRFVTGLFKKGPKSDDVEK